MNKITKYVNSMKLASVFMAGVALVSLSSCYDDDSSTGKGVNTIAISGIDTEGYTVTSYAGKYLDITPEVKSAYSDEELKFEWLAYSYNTDMKFDDGKFDLGKDTPSGKFIKLGEEKNLHCEMNLSPDLYYLVLRVTAPDGLQNFVRTKLQTVTELSTGYYILKETADGNSDVDHFDNRDNKLNANLISTAYGAPMQGKPSNLTVAFNHCYTMEDGSLNACGIAAVTTESGNFKCYNTKDFSSVFDRTNMLFSGALEADEEVYGFGQGRTAIFFVTSKGVRSQAPYASYKGYTSGMYGLTHGDAASANYITGNSYTVYWSEKDYSFHYSDSKSGYTTAISYPGYSCLDRGQTSNNAFFVLQNAKNERKVVRLNLASAGPALLVDPDIVAGTHMAKATDFSVCYSGASYVYCIDGNKVYAYDVTTQEETELLFDGLPASENIAYISCNYYGSASTMTLIVGTQNGDNYTLRFYKMLGGKPDGNPVYSVSGKGKVKSVRYTSPTTYQTTEQD